MATSGRFFQVHGLSVSYAGLQALSGLSIELDPGEVLGILGPNGAGKSTALKAILGWERPDSGTVRLDGTELTRSSVQRRVHRGLAMVPEGRGILGSLTVAENLRLGAYAVRHRVNEKALLEEVLELFPILRSRASQSGSTLSGGEAAMLAVGRALMSQPRLLLLDEPSLGLAPIATTRLFESLHRLKERGVTMVIVEQRAADLFDIADSVILINRGRAEEPRLPGELDEVSIAQGYFGE